MLLANGVSLKQIQDWLGHSDFAITANVYAHLDFSAKQATAEAMTWIGNTSLAHAMEADESIAIPVVECTNKDNGSIQSLSDVIHSLIATGIQMEVILVWLKQVDEDIAKGMDLTESFQKFHRSIAV